MLLTDASQFHSAGCSVQFKDILKSLDPNLVSSSFQLGHLRGYQVHISHILHFVLFLKIDFSVFLTDKRKFHKAFYVNICSCYKFQSHIRKKVLHEFLLLSVTHLFK